MNRPNDTPALRHKTVSIPPEAYDRLFELREKVAKHAARLPSHAQEFLDQHQAGGSQKYTFGIVLWLACEMAIAELEEK